MLDRLASLTCVLKDALHRERETARQLSAAGLGFLLFARKSRPTALELIRDGFHWNGLLLFKTEDDYHGQIEKRRIRVSDELDPAVPYLDFPDARFVAEVQREAI